MNTVVQVLLPDTSFNMFHSTWSPLHYAAQDGYVDIMDLLLKFGANVDRATAEGHTSLHIAAENGHDDVVK